MAFSLFYYLYSEAKASNPEAINDGFRLNIAVRQNRVAPKPVLWDRLFYGP